MRPICLMAALVAAFFVSSAWAQPQCMPREVMTGGLVGKYGERLIGRGLTQPHGQKFELFIAPETGTWSAIVTLPTGLSCWIGRRSRQIVTPNSKGSDFQSNRRGW